MKPLKARTSNNRQLTKQRIVIILGYTTEGCKEREEFSGATGSMRGHNS